MGCNSLMVFLPLSIVVATLLNVTKDEAYDIASHYLLFKNLYAKLLDELVQ